MRLGLVVSAVCMLSLGACATVDIADMTTLGGDTAIAQADKTNVVITASDKLYAEFEDKGLCQSETERMKSAAAFLLQGRQALTNHPEGAYVTKVSDFEQLQVDMVQATLLVKNTSKAAEIYLDLAEPESDFRPELKRLEKAVYATQSAKIQFKLVSDKIGETDFSKFDAAAEDLRKVTNVYGDRVREQAQTKTDAAS